MKTLKAVEVNECGGGLYFGCYVYIKHDETEYTDERDGLLRINCVEPNKCKEAVIRDAKRVAMANNVSFINLIEFSAGIPLVESYAKMNREA